MMNVKKNPGWRPGSTKEHSYDRSTFTPFYGGRKALF
jgi:hypothetical protein